MIMIAYALIVNIPCIILKRFNRARLKCYLNSTPQIFLLPNGVK